MFYIGIDVGKFNHCACVIDSIGEVFIEPFYFPNNVEGFSLFLDKTKAFSSKRHIVGLESTGHYGDNFVRFLIDRGFSVGMINPISTSCERNKKIRKTKNDKKDTFLICHVLQSRDFTWITQSKLDMKVAKELTRYHSDLSKDLNRYKPNIFVKLYMKNKDILLNHTEYTL